jgi:hypothetical protein
MAGAEIFATLDPVGVPRLIELQIARPEEHDLLGAELLRRDDSSANAAVEAMLSAGAISSMA